MKKVLLLVAYVLVSAIAFQVLGGWTMLFSIGAPALYVVGWIIHYAFIGKKRRDAEVQDLIVKTITVLKKNDSQKWLDVLFSLKRRAGISFMFNNGYLPPLVMDFSNEFLGKFLGYLLREKDYPDKLYISIVSHLRKKREKKDINAIVEAVGLSNPVALGRFKQLMANH
ncbi:MAG: hypothetical protein WC310_02140 [Patescibacteria group bacterium]|jgi:hypothetical protein